MCEESGAIKNTIAQIYWAAHAESKFLWMRVGDEEERIAKVYAAEKCYQHFSQSAAYIMGYMCKAFVSSLKTAN